MSLLFRNVAVFDSPNAAWLDGRQDVLVEHGQIVSVLPHGVGERPADAEVVEGEGKWLLPGFIEAHVHICSIFVEKPGPDVLLWGPRQMKKNLAMCVRTGFTTVRDMMSPIHQVNRLRSAARKGKILAPRILSPGPFVSPPGGYPYFLPEENVLMRQTLGPLRWFLSEPKEALPAVRWLHEHGADFIKVAVTHRRYDSGATPLPCFDDAMYGHIADAAHRHDMKVAVHASWIEGYQRAARLPVDTIEHLPNDGLFTEEDLEAIRRRGLQWTPTLKAMRDLAIEEPLSHRNFKLLDDPNWREALVPAVRDTMRVAAADRWSKENTDILGKEVAQGGEERRVENFQRLLKAGIDVGVGTDAGVPVCSFAHLRQEMELMAESGMAPARILRAATHVNAQTIGMADQIGAIKPRMRADLLLLNGDPTADINHVYSLERVYKDGQPVRPFRLASDPLPPRLVGSAEPKRRPGLPLVGGSR